MIIACATDRRFVQLAGVMLASLFDKGEIGEDWRVIVFGYRLRARDKANLRKCCGGNADRLEFIDVDPRSEALRGLLASQSSVHPTTYVRILIPALVPDAHGRLLYLDSDILIEGSLQPLDHMELDGFPLGAVEGNDTHPKLDGRIDFDPEQTYFNAGVLLVDLDAWRAGDLTKRVLDFARENGERLTFADQDALNCVLGGRFRELDPKWNATRPAAEKGCDDLRIAHFTGTKPWSAACRHPSRSAFLRYRQQTPWRNKRLATRFETRMARSLHKRRVALKRWWMQGGAPKAEA